MIKLIVFCNVHNLLSLQLCEYECAGAHVHVSKCVRVACVSYIIVSVN